MKITKCNSHVIGSHVVSVSNARQEAVKGTSVWVNKAEVWINRKCGQIIDVRGGLVDNPEWELF